MRSRAILALLFVICATSSTALAEDDRNGPGPNDAELAAARSLFAEALHDQEEGRAAVALQKFIRVRSVRDTAQVEYRIAACQESLGRLVAAGDSYRSAIALGQSTPDVAAAAREHVSVLDRRIGRLTLVLPTPAPSEAEILVDGTRPQELAAIPLDPGPHVVTARAPGAGPFRAEVSVLEGGDMTLQIALAPRDVASPAPPPSRRAPLAGWAALGGGLALLVGSGIVLLVRHGDIGTLNSACPGGICGKGSDAAELTSTRSRALAEGPIALSLAVGGVLASSAGLYLLLRPTPSGSVSIVPTGCGGALLGTF